MSMGRGCRDRRLSRGRWRFDSPSYRYKQATDSSDGQQILALHFLDAPFPRAPGTFVLFGAIELRIARLNLLHSGIGAFLEIAGRGKARGFSLQSRGAYTRIAATAPSFGSSDVIAIEFGQPERGASTSPRCHT